MCLLQVVLGKRIRDVGYRKQANPILAEMPTLLDSDRS